MRMSSSNSFAKNHLNQSVSSKSMRRSDASKSYAKVVTKLTCVGCNLEFRPN